MLGRFNSKGITTMSATEKQSQPVQMWNGLAFSYVTEKEAKAMTKDGTHERTAGKDANTLKPADYFTLGLAGAPKAAPKAPKTATKKPPRRGKGTYATTQMKAG